MRTFALTCVVAALLVLAQGSLATHPNVDSHADHATFVAASLGDFDDRANHLFRALDANGDLFVTPDDVLARPQAVEEHLPGISSEDVAAFVDAADTNNDGKLSRDELKAALAQGAGAVMERADELEAAAEGEMKEEMAAEEAPALVETQASTSASVKRMRARRAGRGIFGAIKKGVKSVGNFITGAVKSSVRSIGDKIMGRVDTSQDQCVMCQYLIERMETNVRQAAVFPSFAAGPQVTAALAGDVMEAPIRKAAAGSAPFRRAAVAASAPAASAGGAADSSPPPLSSFVELAAQQTPREIAAAGMIATTRAATRYQRTMERQKYNEIYRIVDLTLDDVCEQGMPNSYYAYCKNLYNVQPDVVDGLRYQYRPTDICFRIGMCDGSSYITKGMHSRYAQRV